jgi:hypothetical protein
MLNGEFKFGGGWAGEGDGDARRSRATLENALVG